MIESILYKMAIYCRLSLDDGSLGESGSIKTQKKMLEEYCRDNNFTVKEVYIDDGYSELDFDRPAFKRLIADIESGKINLVITKDLSRLGRDYLQTGYYTEQYFPLQNVRYIAVNDGLDTLIDNNDIAPFKNILNDMYAGDIYFVVLVNIKNDNLNEIKILVSESLYDYQSELINFKESNGSKSNNAFS